MFGWKAEREETDDNIKMDLSEIGFRRVYCFHITHDRDHRNTGMSIWIP
jgi:hypothetical protein